MKQKKIHERTWEFILNTGSHITKVVVPIEDYVKNRVTERLKQTEKNTLKSIHVVLLPDFFVDHFIYLDNLEITSQKLKTIYQQGGGNIPGIPQRIHQGGNAANTALALANLGITSHLICRTDLLGHHLLQFFLGKKVDLTGVKTDGILAITTAMEFGENHVNVMVGDTGSVAHFSFDQLDEHDYELISQADLVGVVNWNLNKNGTELAQEIFTLAKKQGSKTFFDSGDPSTRMKDIPVLKEKVLQNSNLDIFGLNENELRYYGGLNVTTKQEELVQAAVSLKKTMHARVDLHTARFSCSITDHPTILSTFDLPKIMRATGAGDAWNAGNICADLLGFSDEERLFFANSCAARYISSPNPLHPSIEDIIISLRRQPGENPKVYK